MPLVANNEGHNNLRKKELLPRSRRIAPNLKPKLIGAGLQSVSAELADPPVSISDTTSNFCRILRTAEFDGDALGWEAPGCV